MSTKSSKPLRGKRGGEGEEEEGRQLQGQPLRLTDLLSKYCEGLAQTLHPPPEPDIHLQKLSQPEKETVSPVQLDPQAQAA